MHFVIEINIFDTIFAFVSQRIYELENRPILADYLVNTLIFNVSEEVEHFTNVLCTPPWPSWEHNYPTRSATKLLGRLQPFQEGHNILTNAVALPVV